VLYDIYDGIPVVELPIWEVDVPDPVLPDALNDDDSVVECGDVVGDETAPPVWSAGLWCSGCRGGGYSAVTSVMAVRVLDSSTMVLLVA
jgi:hypothetical protein